jgi:transketolase
MSQRDVIIEKIYSHALNDSNIVFLSVDFGAPALDLFREKLPDQFIHVGISEQNAIDVAAGLAMSGKKVFVYGMAPFISLRCIEQIKMSLAQMSLPVVILSVGVGLGYADAGPTHYATEDVGALRSIVNLEIYTISSNQQAGKLADYLLDAQLNCPVFVRLDREALRENSLQNSSEDIHMGYSYIHKSASDSLVIGSGYGVSLAENALNKYHEEFSLIDLFRVKPFPKRLIEEFKNFKKIIFVEEQTEGSTCFGNLLAKVHGANPVLLKSCEFNSLDLGEKYFYENGGRSYLHETAGFTSDAIINILNNKT